MDITSVMESIPPILGLAMLFVAFFVLRALLRWAGKHIGIVAAFVCMVPFVVLIYYIYKNYPDFMFTALKVIGGIIVALVAIPFIKKHFTVMFFCASVAASFAVLLLSFTWAPRQAATASFCVSMFWLSEMAAIIFMCNKRRQILLHAYRERMRLEAVRKEAEAKRKEAYAQSIRDSQAAQMAKEFAKTKPPEPISPIFTTCEPILKPEPVKEVHHLNLTPYEMLGDWEPPQDYTPPEEFEVPEAYDAPDGYEVDEAWYNLLKERKKELNKELNIKKVIEGKFEENIEYQKKVMEWRSPRPIDKFCGKNGVDYEYYVAQQLQKIGYVDINVTQRSNDYGADIIAYMPDGKRVCIQCKKYNGHSVGNKAVQEIIGAKPMYDCDIAMVITTSTFSHNACELAEKNNVILVPNFQ